jgi:hypothetical protein
MIDDMEASVRVMVPEEVPLPSVSDGMNPYGALGLMARPKLTLKPRNGDKTSSPQGQYSTRRLVAPELLRIPFYVLNPAQKR